MTLASLDTTLRSFLSETGMMNLLSQTGLKAPLGKAWRFIQNVPRFQREIDLTADLRFFKRKYSFLAEGSSVTDPARKVLIVSLTDWVAQVKMEGMLAKALQLQGYTPVILTQRSCRHALKYFKVFGYDQFFFFDDLVQTVNLSQHHVAEKAIFLGKHFFMYQHLKRTRNGG